MLATIDDEKSEHEQLPNADADADAEQPPAVDEDVVQPEPEDSSNGGDGSAAAPVDAPVPAAAPPANAPRARKPVVLSVVSQQYDRGQKGYLDKTEKKIRELDSENLGQLDVNAVYGLMQSFQAEQQKAITLKWVVIALSGFAVLLCLANIGTSFAAATLAKDVTTTPDGLLISTTDGEALATGSVETIYDLEVADGSATPVRDANSTGDRLLRSRGLQVPKYGLGGDENDGFQISQDKLNKVMKKFCGSWSGVQSYGCNGLRNCANGVNKVRFMYGCGQSELTLENVPVCVDADTWVFKLTTKVVSGDSNHAQLCRNEFGSNSVVADWQYDIRDNLTVKQVKKQIATNLGIDETYDEMHYFVEYQGRRSPNNNNNNNEVYFFENQGDSSAPNGWDVYDEYAGLVLSSDTNLGGRVLCMDLNDYTEVQFDFRTNRGDAWWIDCNGDQRDPCPVSGPTC